MSVSDSPLVVIVMGSKSDWPTMEEAAKILDEFDVPYEAKVASAHRTPELVEGITKTAEDRGVEVIIAGAGGAAHLPGVVAAQTLVPVLGVPIQSKALNGLDSLLSIVQMPGGIPVGTLGIGNAGARNAGLLTVAILGTTRPELREKLREYRRKQADKVREQSLP